MSKPSVYSGIIHNFDFIFYRKFCLIDIFKPVYLEVAILKLTSPPEITLNMLPSVLSPIARNEKKTRDITGKYTRHSNYNYIFHFKTPIAANKAVVEDFIPVEHVIICLPKIDGVLEFVVPKALLEANKARRSIMTSLANVALKSGDGQNIVTLHQVGVAVDDSLKNVVQPNENIINQILQQWLCEVVDDKTFIITTNEKAGRANVTFHQNSRPDICLMKKESHYGLVVSEMEVDQSHETGDSEMETETLFGVAGECKFTQNAEPQLFANMMAVAGAVAEMAIENRQFFQQIKIYGVLCHYTKDEAYLYSIDLNFQMQTSHIFKYMESFNEPLSCSVGEQIQNALHLCRFRK